MCKLSETTFNITFVTLRLVVSFFDVSLGSVKVGKLWSRKEAVSHPSGVSQAQAVMNGHERLNATSRHHETDGSILSTAWTDCLMAAQLSSFSSWRDDLAHSHSDCSHQKAASLTGVIQKYTRADWLSCELFCLTILMDCSSKKSVMSWCCFTWYEFLFNLVIVFLLTQSHQLAHTEESAI